MNNWTPDNVRKLAFFVVVAGAGIYMLLNGMALGGLGSLVDLLSKVSP